MLLLSDKQLVMLPNNKQSKTSGPNRGLLALFGLFKFLINGTYGRSI